MKSKSCTIYCSWMKSAQVERSLGVSQTAVKLAFTAKVQREILVVGVERHFLFLTKGRNELPPTFCF